MTFANRAAPALALIALTCFGQQPAPAFDAASVRPSENVRDEKFGVETTPKSLTIRGTSLKAIVEWAYDMPPFHAAGPEWLSSTGFDIAARTAQPVDHADRFRPMLRALLAERFALKVHTERREMQSFELTVAKGGPKFHASTTEGPPLFHSDGRPGVLTAERVSMTDLASKFSEPLGRPVVDATGLTGRYDIRIDATAYMLDRDAGGGGGRLDVMSILFTALQQQLGVKLEGRRETVDILVVDHAEKTPTEN